jgi:hypothetical protein
LPKIHYTHPLITDVIYKVVYNFQKKEETVVVLDPLPLPVVAMAATGVHLLITLGHILTVQ